MKYPRVLVGGPRLAAIGLLLALLASCGIPEEVPPPAQLLSKEKMVSLLVQLHLLESRVEASHLSADSARALFQSQQREILRQNHLLEADSVLQHSYRYYSINHKDMDEIYAAVIDSLTHRETKLAGGVKPPPVHQ